MSKPIFIVRFPFISDTQQYERIVERLDRQLGKDYHVLCPMDNKTEQVQFECFNASNAADKEIEEIKQMVLKQISYEQ
jgi:hypothetical protein